MYMKNRRYISTVLCLLLMLGVSTVSYGQIVKGKVFGGGQLAQVNGGTAEAACNVNINSGSVYGEVYGAGEGMKSYETDYKADVAKVTGNTKVNLGTGRDGGGTAWRDVFGGGALAKVDGDTHVSMSGGHVAANIFGGGMGDIKKVSTGPDAAYDRTGGNLKITSADVTGNTNVEITGGDIIWNRTSLTHPLAATITYTYTKTIVEEDVTYETAATTTEAAKEELEKAGYTSVSVTTSSGPVDGVYTYTVKRTSTLTEVVLSTNTDRIGQLVADGFTKDEEKTKEEASNLVTGDIVYWDTDVRTPNYSDESNPKHKIHNELFYDETNGRFLIEHNIFGGGYVACHVGKYYKEGDVIPSGKSVGDLVANTGTASVTMTRGLGDNELTATNQWKDSFDDYAHPHFYAFGGGYGAYTTVGNTKVEVNVTNYDQRLNAETDKQLVRPRREGEGRSLTGDPTDDNPIKIGIYNNQYGIAQATVLGVLGGSYAGFVKGNTEVTIGGKTFISRVYGGGFGQLEAYNELQALDVIYSTGTGTGEVQRTREFLGEVAGNTLVNIKGGNIYGNVYGGGAGVESADMTGNGTIDTDFLMGRVMGKTDVNIYSNANVFGNVYGGGDIANVLGEGTGVDRKRIETNENLDDDFATNLNIYGGKVYGNVFGGGSGRPANKVASYNQATDNFNSVRVGMVGKDLTDYPEANLVNLQGHTRVHIYNGTATQEDVDLGVATQEGDLVWPCVYGDIYGGCAYGVVTGTSEVLIDGGRIGNDIFGGGLGDIEELKDAQGHVTGYGKVTSANVLGNSIVTINGGYALWNEMSDEKGNVKTWPRDNYTRRNAEIADANEFFYNAAIKRFTLDHNVYGGGNVACVVGRYKNKASKETADDRFKPADKPVKRFPVLFKDGEFKSGNTIVMMNESHFSDPELFMNYAKWTEAPDWSLAAKCWQATMEEQREPQFSVFGAGKGLLTKTTHNAQARVEVLAVRYDIDGNLLYYQDASKSLDNVAPAGDGHTIAYGPAEHWTVGWDYDYEYMLQWTDEDNDGGTDKARLANFFPEKSWVRPNYVDAERRLRTAAFAKQIGVAGNTVMQIVGGGYDGCVEGNTLASGESRAIIGKMYGGGYGSYDGWKLAMDLDKYNQEHSLEAHSYQNFVGTVGGQSVLNIDRGCLVRGDVFAGGAGVESLKLDNTHNIIPETSPDYESVSYHDFDQVARAGSTHLKFGLIGASEAYNFVVPVVYGDVYAGGDVANVTGIAKSQVKRGQAMQHFFGGGNGRLKNQCRDYTKLGSVGATLMHFDYVRDADQSIKRYKKNYGAVDSVEYILEPTVWDRVYAGGRNGLVRGGYSKATGDEVEPGDTKLLIDGGQFGYNIFGGGEGTIDTLVVNGKETYEITSADILGNTQIVVNGGEQNIDQIWDSKKYEWVGLIYDVDGTPYTPQYDPKLTKFNVEHNIYAGGRMACVVGTKVNDSNGRTPGDVGYTLTLANNTGDTKVTMNKGMLDRQYFESFGTPILESWEWRDIYAKHASPFFCVFGGGYGKNALVLGDTHVDVKLDDTEAVKPSDDQQTMHHHDEDGVKVCQAIGGDPVFKVKHEHQEPVYTKFPDGQSLMDIIGGGYSGDVMGTCYVTVDGNTYARNIFGGGYYANAGATVVSVKQGNIDNIYGGGMMGDVRNDVSLTIGQDKATDVNADKTVNGEDETAAASANKEVIILGNVYGANDVAGVVGGVEEVGGGIIPTSGSQGVQIKLNGGNIRGNVYGGGNGNYLYVIDQKVEKVEGVEDDPEHPLLYKVPVRKSVFPSLASMSNAQKIVNISTFRPVTMKVDIDFKGNSASDRLHVDGNIFGGGSSATVSRFSNDTKVALNVGSYIRVGGVFLGSDGDALFDNSNRFMTDFPSINGINLTDPIDWKHDPGNVDIPESFLSTPKASRPDIYKHAIDLYFMPVEMDAMPEVTWGSKKVNSSLDLVNYPENYKNIPDDNPDDQAGLLTDAEIGNFICGGNRGNMNTTTPFHVYFPAGLTITGNIVGGCNNSNYTYTLEGENIQHEGGFLLGSHGVGADHTPQIWLTTFNKFRPTAEGQDGKVLTSGTPHMYAEGNNVYGGCYQSGTVRGDIRVDVRSNMIAGLDSVALRRTTDAERTVASIYGAGYGDQTWVYGDTEVRLGENTDCTSVGHQMSDAFQAGNQSAAANYMFGGGRKGNVVGNTTVRVLNGRVAGCVVGASYAGLLYGNAQTMVGYPELYYRAKENGEYTLDRADKDATHRTYKDEKGNLLIKTAVRYTKGDLVSKAVHDEIIWPEGTTDAQKEAKFEVEHSVPAGNNWSKINIQIDKAIYGGGYALASGSSVGSGSYTVKKYSTENRFHDDIIQNVYEFADADDINGYGGNTFVMVGDVTGDYDTQANPSALSLPAVADGEKLKDHLSLSSRSLEVVNTKTGDDLFGLYYRQTNKEANSGYSGSQPDAETGPYLIVTAETPKLSTDTHKYYRYVGEGGLYGDGHLSLSEGFRNCDILGYGYNGAHPQDPKLMNCVHRFDIARFKDCCVTLLGDRDYASSEGSSAQAASYSVAHVNEIQMESSIQQDADLKNFKAATATMDDKKHSRNYIGLSNAQLELGAIVSNDDFTENGALYHNKDGVLITDDMVIEGTEGTGEKKFGSALSYYNVKKWYLNEYAIGSGKSEYYDDIEAQVKNEQLFQLRNSATARNMFGIFSGYALNVMNYYYDDTEKVQKPFYGPVIGVFEVDLVGIRDGEAGGYAYAQNIHDNSIVQDNDSQVGETGHEATFLESSGNFVFPATSVRKVVDNCFPKAFDNNYRDGAEGHYWYVTGLRYFYNATLTGYTYDDGTLKFDMDNSARLIFLPGAKKGQEVTLKSFHFLDRHSSSDRQNDCDIENKLLTKTGDESSWSTNTQEYYNLSMSISNNTRYTEKEGDADVPYIKYMKQDSYDGGAYSRTPERITTGDIPCDDPQIAIQLTDDVKNNGFEGDGTTTYYSKRLEEPCTAQIVLTVPAVNANGQPVYDANAFEQELSSPADATKTYYMVDPYGDYSTVTYTEAQDMFANGFSVYVLKEYIPVSSSDEYNSDYQYFTESGGSYTQWTPTGTDAEKVSSFNTAKNNGNLYCKPHPKTYEYNLTLTIKYIKGPSYEGKVTVQNCALPGEMIRLSSSSVKIISDAYSLPFDKGYWTIGPGEKKWVDANDHSQGYTWELIDKKGVNGTDANNIPLPDPNTKNLYYPYNPNVSTSAGEMSAVLKNHVYFDDNTQDLYIPAYYFMNGYIAKYSFKVQGIDAVYDVKVLPEDTLLVHNYHRMKPMQGASQVETHIRKAAERYAEDEVRYTADKGQNKLNQQLCYVSRPRVYIENQDDMLEFQKYVNAGGNDYGANLDFFLMTDVAVPADWSVTNFKGIFHGNGHVISGIGSDKALFEANSGEVYNLGLATGKITKNDAQTYNPGYHCCYTKSDNTVYRMDGTAVTTYTDDDFLYGKVAYDLNQYYLEERLDRNAHNMQDAHNHDAYVEEIYENGDYQYARNRATDGNEYLRTQPVPRYITNDFQSVVELADKSQITFHRMSHDVDEARAYYNDDAVRFTQDEINAATESDPAYGKTTNDIKIPATLNEYRPLFEEAQHNTTAALSTTKNDYLFFGQYLNNVTTAGTNQKQALPSALVHTQRNVETMYNRVYRAYGYYRSGNDDLYHFNRDAYVLNPTTTAIDFNGWHDADKDGNGTEREWGGPANGDFFYQKVIDRPASLLGFKIDDAVTRNLLVYNQAEPYSHVTTYDEGTAESAIRYHAVGTVGENRAIGYLHLVERARESDANNDFFAPLAFNVTQRAWYERRPVGYRNVNPRQAMWEGIVLPFTARKVTAILPADAAGEANGEITHFYGDSDKHHEYWLRGLTKMDGDKATFARPGTGLFDDATQETDNNYVYRNDYFANLINYDRTDGYGLWYDEARTENGGKQMPGYIYMTHDIPYIVAFPGNNYYEFSMEGSEIYNVVGTLTGSDVHKKTGVAQYARFEATAPDAGHPITIHASTNDMRTELTSASVLHQGSFLALNTGKNASGTAPDGLVRDGIYGIDNVDGNGDKFDARVKAVLPFRTYMAQNSTPVKGETRAVIYIVEGTAVEGPEPDLDLDQDEAANLSFSVKGLDVTVDNGFEEDRMINVHLVGGQLLLRHLAPNGQSTFRLPKPGLYIINGMKVMAREL